MLSISILRRGTNIAVLIYFAVAAVAAWFTFFVGSQDVPAFVASLMYFALIGYMVLLLYTFLIGLIATSLYIDKRIFARCRWNIFIAAAAYFMSRFILSQSAELRNALPFDKPTVFFIVFALTDTLVRAIPPVNLWNIKGEHQEREVVIAWLENSRKSYGRVIPVFILAILLAFTVDYVWNGVYPEVVVLAPVILGLTWLTSSYILMKTSIGLGRVFYPPPDTEPKPFWRQLARADIRKEASYALWNRSTSLFLASLIALIITLIGTPHLLDLAKELIRSVSENTAITIMGWFSMLAFVLSSTYTTYVLQRWTSWKQVFTLIEDSPDS